MSPPPIHRWKTFWFGLVILAFLGWTWVASMRHVDVLYLNSSVGSSPTTRFLYRNFGSVVITAGQTLGWVEFGWDRSRPSPLLSHRSHQIITLTPKETWFAPAVTVERSAGRFEIHIGHWVLILGFLLPRTGFLLWWHRRLKRLTLS